jgi:starch phosphorylase
MLNETITDLPENLEGLNDLAFNLWSSWHPEAQHIFKQINEIGWKEATHNPVKMLRTVPKDALVRASENASYVNKYNAVMARYTRYMQTKANWFSEHYPDCYNATPIAYFSAEYGLQHSLPFYAGGLGFLAGDHLKECSDMGVPVVAIGFMYSDGYLRQIINSDGWQEGVEEKIQRENAPIKRLYGNDQRILIFKVPYINPHIFFTLWKVEIGRVNLYLLDTDIEENAPEHRNITSRLYSSDNERRLLQEIVLGIGGVHALKELGISYSAIHLNEGHAAFAALERVRQYMEAGLSLEQARGEVEKTLLFTTHTPVPAGHDKFPTWMMDKFFGEYYSQAGKRERILDLGKHIEDPEDHFNMAAFALRISAYANGVSQKHGEIAREMWKSLWDVPDAQNVPIGSITNGVHIPTWLNPRIGALINTTVSRTCPDWLQHHDEEFIWDLIATLPDGKLWALHQMLKMKLLDRIRETKRKSWVQHEADTASVLSGGLLLDPGALTIGFARRFSTYKRADLIFHDIERIKRIVTMPYKPVQIIFAGKAHPADDDGKRILQRIFKITQSPEFAGRVAFVEDYGEQISKYLVQGVDVWLNNPVPPLEASGTSGMKAAINGVLNLSIEDGWWIEGYNGKNGWSFGKSTSVENRDDAADANELYSILEEKVIPLYYSQSFDGIPHEWVAMMKESIRSIAAPYSARRMVKEYVQRYYIPALTAAYENKMNSANKTTE